MSINTNRRPVAAVASAVALAFALAACGGLDGGGGDASRPPSSPSAEAPGGVEGLDVTSVTVAYSDPDANSLMLVPVDSDVVFSVNGMTDATVQMLEATGTVFRVSIDFTAQSPLEATVELVVEDEDGKEYRRQSELAFQSGENEFAALINAGTPVDGGKFAVTWSVNGAVAFSDTLDAERG
ncbi:MAG: hypothetical protein LBG11_01475 [Bifidobacteriaceae bacterium]|jgi:ABC-type glycerol-3-phosphate transport system substrate-binding protein|nr:hypothetical protein [Bifidobacteriaceae bacterium]